MGVHALFAGQGKLDGNKAKQLRVMDCRNAMSFRPLGPSEIRPHGVQDADGEGPDTQRNGGNLRILKHARGGSVQEGNHARPDNDR